MKTVTVRHIGSFLLAACALQAGIPIPVYGQTFDAKPSDGSNSDRTRPPLLSISLGYDREGSRTLSLHGNARGTVDVSTATLRIDGKIPLSSHWIVPLGLTYEQVDFGRRRVDLLPDKAQSLSFFTGVGYHPNENWMILGEITPTLYRLSDIHGSDIGGSAGILAKWDYSASTQLTFGVMAAPDSDLKVLPIIGVDWQLSDQLELSLLIPQPKLIYRADAHWTYHVGADFQSQTFRTERGFGEAAYGALYSHDLATYRRIGLSTGADYQLDRAVSLGLDIGYSLNEQVKYRRSADTLKFDQGIYGGVHLRVGL